jgi:hypothetical protein
VSGIPAFDASWKDVFGTLYHEINEFRTDADVRDAIATGNDDGVLGWMGAQGETGDQPIVGTGAIRTRRGSRRSPGDNPGARAKSNTLEPDGRQRVRGWRTQGQRPARPV